MGGDDNDDGARSAASSAGNNKNNHSSNNQRKKSKWKQGWRDKKKQKRVAQNSDGEGSENKKPKMNHWKKEYDEGKKVAPHEGSFANEEMRKLFGVSIDLPEDGEPPKKEADGEEGHGTNAAEVDSDNGEKKAAESDNSDKNASSGTNPADEESETKADVDKAPKKKLAMLVSFLGSNYSGFQINAKQRTLHAELELALYRAGLISESNFGHPSKYAWSNSARTDRGVHAAAQVCSFKGLMICHRDFVEEVQDEGMRRRRQLDAMRETVNEYLPEDVRVLDFELVTRSFCARTNRDKVRYQYMVPSYLLCSGEETRKAFAGVVANTTEDESKEESKMTPIEASNIVSDRIDCAALAKARDALLGYRISSEQMERLRDGLRLFEGTHSFHNYTRRVGAKDANAARYILSFRPLDPILVPGGKDGDGNERPETQWIPLQIVGQSFLLNQIRKMVSAAVDLARGTVSPEQIRESLNRRCRMKVNVAPAQGLFLDRSYFELYNKHKVENAPKHKDVLEREMLDWVEADDGDEVPAPVRRIEEFKNEKIIPHIVREEENEGNFLKYLYAQDVLYADQVYGSLDDEGGTAADGGKKNGGEENDGGGIEEDGKR